MCFQMRFISDCISSMFAVVTIICLFYLPVRIAVTLHLDYREIYLKIF